MRKHHLVNSDEVKKTDVSRWHGIDIFCLHKYGNTRGTTIEVSKGNDTFCWRVIEA